MRVLLLSLIPIVFLTEVSTARAQTPPAAPPPSTAPAPTPVPAPAQPAPAQPVAPAEPAPPPTTEPGAPGAPPASEPAPAPLPAPPPATAEPPPPSALPELPPPPVAPHAQHSRHSVELIPELGIGFPECSDGDVSNVRCNGIKGGLGLGFEALWRVSPHVAFGAGLLLHGFTFEPKDDLGFRDASAGAVFLGLVGRGYFLSTGPLDPYVELGLGVGALGTQAEEIDGEVYSETAAGPGARLAAGVDFYLGRHLRLGPAISFAHFFVDKVRRCNDDRDCNDLSDSKFGHLTGFWTVGGRLSILLGEPM